MNTKNLAGGNMKTDYDLKLQTEREKLNRLVDEALKNGIPLCKTRDIMDQCRKVDELLVKREEVTQ